MRGGKKIQPNKGRMDRQPELPPPPKIAFDFVRQLWEQDPPEENLRRDPRYQSVTTLRIQPLSEALQPKGEPFLAVLRDVSARGISFVHTRALTNGFILVDFHELTPAPSLLVATVWSKPIRTCYLIGGRIITKYSSIQDPSQP